MSCIYAQTTFPYAMNARDAPGSAPAQRTIASTYQYPNTSRSRTWSSWQLRHKREQLALGVFFYCATFAAVNALVAMMLARNDYACP